MKTQIFGSAYINLHYIVHSLFNINTLSSIMFNTKSAWHTKSNVSI